ncbi:hypothetical protein ACVW16_004175 [Bradyrhizobium sp. USDA 4474]
MSVAKRGCDLEKNNEPGSFSGSFSAYVRRMAKHTEPNDHHPTTSAGIMQFLRGLSERQRALQTEGAQNYAAFLKGSPPPRPATDHERRVGEHLQKLMNGATPAHFLTPAVSRDEQIRAELDAIAFAERHWAKQLDDALDREAQQYVDEHEAEWRALCRDITLTAVRLESLEVRAREMLAPIVGRFGLKLAMASTVGSGFSILGVGDPLSDYRAEALQQGIVSNADIKKASNVR